MSNDVKKRKIRNALIITGSCLGVSALVIASTVVTINLLVPKTKIFAISNTGLESMYNGIINQYARGSVNPLSYYEFEIIANNGELKSWLISNYSKLFIPQNSNNKIDFSLKFENGILDIIPPSNCIFKINSLGILRESNIESSENKISMKFSNPDFLESKFLDYTILDQFKNNIISNMQTNKIVFDNLIIKSDNEKETEEQIKQKLEIQNWVIKCFPESIALSSASFDQDYFGDYVLKLTPTSDYVFLWNRNFENNDSYTLNRLELTVNFNNIFIINDTNFYNTLTENLNNYLQEQKINYQSWNQHFENKDYFYEDLRSFISDEIIKLINNEIYLNDIVTNLSISTNSIDVQINSKYKFISNVFDFSSNNITINNLLFSKVINFSDSNLNNFFNGIQKIITDNKYNKNQFYSWFIQNDFKDYISKNLYTADDKLIDIQWIENTSFDYVNGIIEITPNSFAEIKLPDNYNGNISLDAKGNIIISNLKYLD